MINQPSLFQFENVRKSTNYIPPSGSNQPFQVGNGTIILQTINDEIDNYKFNLIIQSGIVNSGNLFTIGGHVIEFPYNSLNINNGKLVINGILSMMNDASLMNNNILEFADNSSLNMMDNSYLEIPKSFTLNIGNNVNFNLDDNSQLRINGILNISYSSTSLLNSKNVFISNDAIINITGLPRDRQYSMTDYVNDLRKHYYVENSTGSKYIPNSGSVLYKWIDGNYDQHSDVLSLTIENGNVVLGDMKLSLLGIPNNVTNGMKIISNLIINKDASLEISNEYNSYTYVEPTLFISQVIGNSKQSGSCIVDGNINVTGNGIINLDRGGSLIVNGSIHVKDNGRIISTNNNSPVLFINGNLYLDNDTMLENFTYDQISFVNDGKIIILNPNKTNDKKVIFSTPDEIDKSNTMKLFMDRLNRVEYHIQPNCGISIDRNFNNFNDMTSWYGNMRLEKAVKDKYIIWHEDAFIQFDHDILPWLDESSSLLQVGFVFGSVGNNDKEKLQNAVNKFIYAGFPNILFIYKLQNHTNEFILSLNKCNTVSCVYHQLNNSYSLRTDNIGILMLKNNLNKIDTNVIMNESTKSIFINDINNTSFNLP